MNEQTLTQMATGHQHRWMVRVDTHRVFCPDCERARARVDVTEQAAEVAREAERRHPPVAGAA